MGDDLIRATYELEPPGSGPLLGEVQTTGLPRGPAAVAARVVGEEGGRTVLEYPASNWGADVTMLVSALVAGEATEVAALSRCRLVDLELPPGLLPGPAVGPPPAVLVGAIVKPSLGLAPGEVAAVAGALARGGARLVKDDELLGDPPWCRLDERVRAVADALPPEVVYCANVSGRAGSLLERAERAVAAGATGLMVNGVAQGLDAVRELRQAGFGVPILVHRAGSGPWVRNRDVGVSGPVLCALTRLCGADFVIVGAFGGKLFEEDEEVRANLDACRRPLPGSPPAAAGVLGGGMGPHNAGQQVEAAGRSGVVVLLGSAAYHHPGGVEEGVRAAVAAVASAPVAP